MGYRMKGSTFFNKSAFKHNTHEDHTHGLEKGKQGPEEFHKGERDFTEDVWPFATNRLLGPKGNRKGTSPIPHGMNAPTTREKIKNYAKSLKGLVKGGVIRAGRILGAAVTVPLAIAMAIPKTAGAGSTIDQSKKLTDKQLESVKHIDPRTFTNKRLEETKKRIIKNK